MSTQRLVFLHRLRALSTVNACASYVQTYLYSHLSYKMDIAVSEVPTSWYFAERNIYNIFCLNNEEVIGLLNFIISISKYIRGGEGVQKAWEAEEKRKKEVSKHVVLFAKINRS